MANWDYREQKRDRKFVDTQTLSIKFKSKKEEPSINYDTLPEQLNSTIFRSKRSNKDFNIDMGSIYL